MDPRKLFGQKENKKDSKNKKPIQVKLKINLWTIAGALLVIFFVLPVIITAFQMMGSSNKVDISQVLSDVKEQKIERVLIESDKLVVNYKDGSIKFSTKESVEGFSNLLKDSGIDPSTV